MKTKIFTLIIAFLSCAAITQAEESPAGIQTMWCFSGAVLSKTAMVALAHKTGKSLGGPAEVAVMGTACAGGIATVRTMAGAEVAEAPAQEQLSKQDSETLTNEE